MIGRCLSIYRNIMAPKKYLKALAATAHKAGLAVHIAKRSRASVDNFVDIPVPAQTHDNDLHVIEISGPNERWLVSTKWC